MTDSGFSGLPPGARPAPTSAADAARAARTDVLKVVDTTGMLRDNARAQRLSGEIVAANDDGTLKIATSEGTVTVQKPRDRPDLIVGARLEIDVPAGRPPRQISVRETTPPPQTSAPRDINTRPADIPVDPEAPPIITTPARPPVAIPEQPELPPVTTRPLPVTPEQIVRLLPLPPEQAAQIIRPPALTLDVVMPPLPQTIIAAAQIIAAAAPAELSAEIARTLLTLPAPVIQQAPALLPTAPPQTVTEQLVDTLLRLNQPQPIAAPLLTAPTTLPAPTIPAAQITLEPLALPRATQAFVMALPENFIQAAAPAVTTQGAAIPLLSSPLLNTPLLTTTTPPASSGLIAPKMDAQILQIDTPIVKIGPPVIPGAPVTTTPTITPTMPAVAGALQGEVRGITAQNFPVLSLNFPALNALQDFIMQFPADNMPPGAPVTIMPQPGTATPGTAAVAAAGFTPLPEFFTSGLWPAFDEAFQALQQAAPQAAQLLAQTSIPNAASPLRMPAVMMMFMAAMKGGDLQSWLGEKTVDTLRRIGKADVLARLTRDSGTLSRLSATEPATPQDWRSTALPIMWDNHVHKMFLHVRHDREQGKDGQEGQKNGTRFILDIQPPRMGDVQLDGLHRPGENAGRLDMIIRTKKQLSPTMQQAMRRLYINALDQTAMSGELSFQGKEEGWVKVG